MTRQVVLDTETTGLDVGKDHRIIEIGCIELLERRPSGRQLHHYLNPQREIDPGAVEVHGIDSAFLADKPSFADIAEELMQFLDGCELIIHNAAFDVGFLQAELARLADSHASIDQHCEVIDTLGMARKRYPGQRNSLDALCRRLDVDNTARQLHGALLDAQLLAQVYLAMTAGQSSLELATAMVPASGPAAVVDVSTPRLVLRAGADELAAHKAWLDDLDKACVDGSVWRRPAQAAKVDG